MLYIVIIIKKKNIKRKSFIFTAYRIVNVIISRISAQCSPLYFNRRFLGVYFKPELDCFLYASDNFLCFHERCEHGNFFNNRRNVLVYHSFSRVDAFSRVIDTDTRCHLITAPPSPRRHTVRLMCVFAFDLRSESCTNPDSAVQNILSETERRKSLRPHSDFVIYSARADILPFKRVKKKKKLNRRLYY